MSKFVSGVRNQKLIVNSTGINVQDAAFRVLAGDGSAALPSIAFTGDPNTGIYRLGPDNLAIALGGAKYIDFSTTIAGFATKVQAIVGSAQTPTYSFAAAPSTGTYLKIESNIATQVDGLRSIESINKKVNKGLVLDFSNDDAPLNNNSKLSINFGVLYPLSRVIGVTDATGRTVSAAVYMGQDNQTKTASNAWSNWSSVDILNMRFTTMRFGDGGTQCFFHIADNFTNSSSLYNNYIEVCAVGDKIKVVIAINDVVRIERMTTNDVISTTGWTDVEIVLGSGGNNILINGASTPVTDIIGTNSTTSTVTNFTNRFHPSSLWFGLCTGVSSSTTELFDYYLANLYIQETASNSNYVVTRFSNGNNAHHVEITPDAIELGAGIKFNIGTTGPSDIVGTATLSSGTATVLTTKITTNSKVFITRNTISGSLGFLSAPSAFIVAGTSFVINSSSGSDNSTVNWFIIN